jgi:carbonic anhydrase
MRLFSTGLKDWKQSWKSDLRASISVAFIAIPLGLGIGLASGVPPMAAVIPSVIGGLLLAWFSGGHVIVHSTPKMLIGVTAVAVITLGGDDLLLGYRLYLAAIVFAGIIQFLLGSLRLGVIGDLIPASVIKSLLAAVGVFIIVKQIPVLVGSHLHPEDIVQMTRMLPVLLADINPLVALIGLLSVIVMFLHPSFEFPAIKAIPAAVWVIALSIAYSYLLGFEYGGEMFGFEFNSKFLIDIPSSVAQMVAYPDFSLWQAWDFWNVVIAVVVISSIEAILSTKAIDRLDAKKRKSNVNRELSVVGLGTAASGMIGGLPIIPGIVPSSVGASHNGKGMLMNVFHVVWILILIVLLGSQLQHIPLAALAGILIHTGYKLINPSEIRNIYRIGWDELLIFSSTLVVTLTTDLIIGIGIGVMLTIVIHIVRLRSLLKLFTILFKPNVVSYEEEDDSETFHISVSGYSNFLNYPQLKKALDVVPREASIIVDFSMAEFIDHSVMEHLAEHEENHIRRGGNFEVIGIDTHLSSAKHPLSTRFKGTKEVVARSTPLTSRQQKLESTAKELGWKFDANVMLFVRDFEQFHLFRFKSVDRVYNRMFGTSNGLMVTIQDVDYHEGELHTKEDGHTTVATIDLKNPIPLFTIEKELIFDKLAALAGYDDIDFKNFKEFSDIFRLKGENEAEVREYFKSDMLRFLEKSLVYRLESDGNRMLLMSKNRTMSVAEISELVVFIGGFTPHLTRTA